MFDDYMATANNYDDVAIERAQEFSASENLTHAFVEKPAMYGLLADVAGKRVLCVGCGTGEERAELLDRKAEVYAIDKSVVSIEYAKEHVPGAHFRVLDMDEELERLSADGPFDLVYSSLTVHYSRDVRVLFTNIWDLLAPRGQFLFSACHPVKWSAEAHRDPTDDKKKSFLMGYRRDGEKLRIYGNYLEEQRLRQSYPSGLVVDYWTRSPSSYFSLLTSTGFRVLDFLEPAPLPEVESIDPVFWEINRRLPQWVVFRAEKTGPVPEANR